MSEALLQTIITATATVLVAVVTVQGVRINGRIKRVQHQVENDHSTNLREELDRRHAETRGWFDLINRRLVAGDERMGRLEDTLTRHQRELDELEDTVNTRRKE
ncbi:DUF2746 domain-containing protein [Microbacterium sp. TNHR37B]|uniref:DUF2746 domain-containing protein n=1 Tax=Microbacterium sp. TNHR37B TaxID=1775956 RepID=UPI0007B3184A|nr:DUF2746 domain-containing protein [Microbacterium sp. TNHR37B]KZE91172.1 hypothetical protein AVP41_00707 [Microbacterium sp. TNHR37B]